MLEKFLTEAEAKKYVLLPEQKQLIQCGVKEASELMKHVTESKTITTFKFTTEEKKQAKQEPVTKAPVVNVPIDKDLQKQIQKLQRALAQIEHNIETLQKEKIAIELQMADPAIYSDTQQFHVVEKSYQDKNALIRSMNKEYEIAFNDLLILESK